jgi:hypothetical protein
MGIARSTYYDRSDGRLTTPRLWKPCLRSATSLNSTAIVVLALLFVKGLRREP